MKKIFFLLLPFLLLASCEVIEAPYFEESYLNSLPADERCLLDAANIRANLTNVPLQKRVLLEEMTGHQCGNCPTATKEASRLRNLFGEELIFVGIHAGPLANHNPAAPKYSSDYTTEQGDEWYATLNNRNAVPLGMVDRSLIGTNAKEWESFVRQRLEAPLKAQIQLYTCYKADSLELGVVVDITALERLGEETRLSVVLVEDKIIDWQKDYSVSSGSPDIPDYVHSNVFRAALNGTWGEPVSNGEIAKDAMFIKSYSIQLKPGWNPENCKVVAYVHDFGTKEVFQAALRDLME